MWDDGLCCSLVCGLLLPWLNEVLISAFELKSRYFVFTKAILWTPVVTLKQALRLLSGALHYILSSIMTYVKFSTYDVRRPISEDGLGELQSLKT